MQRVKQPVGEGIDTDGNKRDKQNEKGLKQISFRTEQVSEWMAKMIYSNESYQNKKIPKKWELSKQTKQNNKKMP